MRFLLIAAAAAGTVLAAMPPVEAKSFWLKCGNQEINLDSARERFSLTADKVYQGPATFNPLQIDFEVPLLVFQGNSGIKTVYSIDRKSLRYTKTIMQRIAVSAYLDSGWVPQEPRDNLPNPKFGECSIMKTPPTAGNQI